MKKLLLILLCLPLIGFGQCVGDCQNGYGVFTSAEGTYKGNWKDGKVHGNGLFKGSSYTYDGEYVNGQKHGQGKMIYTNGTIEEGFFEYNKFVRANSGCVSGDCFDGYGKYEWTAGDKYSGNYKNGKRNGFGTYTWANGDEYQGNLKNNEKHGQGTYTWSSGEKWRGKWQNNARNGYGTYTWADGTVERGEWINNVYQEPKTSNTTTFKPKITPKPKKPKRSSSRMYPKDQIGYIMNPTACPFGINYFVFLGGNFGFYADYRNDFGILAKKPSGYDSAFDDYSWVVYTMESVPTGQPQDISEKGYTTFNAGIASSIRFDNSVLILYAGYGSSTKKIVMYDEYYEDVLGDFYYVSNKSTETFSNLNFGLVFQPYLNTVSYQIGYDTSVPGVNFGIGFTW